MAFIGNNNTTQGFTPAIDYFNGNGSTTAFTLSRPVASVAQVQVVIGNVPQNPGSAYTVSGNTITFTSAPPSGTSNIYVYYTSPITQVIAPGQGTVGLTQISATGTASSSTFLRGDGSWTNQSSIAAGSATNLAGGGAGQVPYQSASGTTAMLAAGTAGQILQSNGAAAPSWITPSSGGVTSLTAGNGITVSASTGAVTVSQGIPSNTSVGSYVFAYYNASSVGNGPTYNDSVAGTTIYAAGTFGRFYGNVATSIGTGTWKCLGYGKGVSDGCGGTAVTATLFVRTA